MIVIDWGAFGLGAFAGALAGVLFFAGLAFGMRLGLRSAHPIRVLLLSGGLRVAALLGLGWLVAGQGASALAGYALAFLAVRFAAIHIARAPVKTESSRWN